MIHIRKTNTSAENVQQSLTTWYPVALLSYNIKMNDSIIDKTKHNALRVYSNNNN